MELYPLSMLHAPSIFRYLSDVNESPDIFFPRPEKELHTLDWINAIWNAGVIAYVVEDGQYNAVGVITFKPINDVWQIGFYFKKSVRGSGLAKYIKKALKAFEGEKIIATPYQTNTACFKFLAKLGFKHVRNDGILAIHELVA